MLERLDGTSGACDGDLEEEKWPVLAKLIQIFEQDGEREQPFWFGVCRS